MVRERVRGKREELSSRNIRKLIETESLEDLRADWREWLSGFESRSAAMASFAAECTQLGAQ